MSLVMAQLEHRAKKWAPVFGIKRCDNKDSEHRAKKWAPVFGIKRCDNKDSEHRAKKWAPVFGFKRCDTKDLERADDSHLALSALKPRHGSRLRKASGLVKAALNG